MIDPNHADITGEPTEPPAQSKGKIAGDTKREAGGGAPTPTPQPGPHPPQPPQSGGGQQPKGPTEKGKEGGGNITDQITGALKDVPVLGGELGIEQAVAHGFNKLARQGPYRLDPNQVNPFNPVDWGKMAVDDGWAAWQEGRRMYSVLYGTLLNPNAISQSVANIMQQHDAASTVAKYLITQTQVAPGASLEDFAKLQQVPSQGLGALAQPNQQAVQKTEAQDVGTALSFTGDPTMAFGGEGVWGHALAMLGPQIAGSVLGDQDPLAIMKTLEHFNVRDPQSYGDLLWAASAALLAKGHLSGPVREMLSKIPGMPGHLDELDRQITEHNVKLSNSQDLSFSPSQALQDALQIEPLQETRKTISAAAKEVVPKTFKDANGHIWTSTAQAEKEIAGRRRAALRKVGATSLDELMTKAATEGLSGPAARQITQHWKDFGLPYALEHWQPGDVPLRDPLAALEQVAKEDPGRHQAAAQHQMMTNAYLALMGHGFNTTSSFSSSLFRSLAGHSRSVDAMREMWAGSVSHLLQDSGVKGTDITKAIEGDQDVYTALPAAGKQVVDNARLLSAKLRELAKSSGHREDFVGNWFPRLSIKPDVLKRHIAHSGTRLAATESKQHRATRIVTRQVEGENGPELRLVSAPAHATVESTNRALAAEREALVGKLTSPGTTPEEVVRHIEQSLHDDQISELAKHDDEIKAILKLTTHDPGAAAERANALAQIFFPPVEADFLKSMPHALSSQLHAINATRALRVLQDAKVKVTDPATGVARAASMAVPLSSSQRVREHFTRLGYQRGTGRFADWMLAPDFAKLLDRATSGGEDAFTRATQLERAAIKGIMYFPTVHGMNMSARLGMFSLQHPLQTARWLLRGQGPFFMARHPLQSMGRGIETRLGTKAPTGEAGIGTFSDHESPTHDRDMLALRMEAYLSGVLPSLRSNRYGSELLRSLSVASGDVPAMEAEAHPITQGIADKMKGTPMAAVGKLASGYGNFYEHTQNLMWSAINDFSVMVYHIEKEAMVRAGVDEESAKLMAARSANTYAGHVAPEDWNPVTRKIAGLSMFAPNWWRTWVELFAPIYRHSGAANTPEMARYMAKREALTMVSALAWQKLSGQPLNYLMSGHWQDQNQPGNQDRIEVTRPEMIDLLHRSGLISQADLDRAKKTGGVVTFENPSARQMLDTERFFGYDSGQPGTPVGPKVAGVQVSLPPDYQSVAQGMMDVTAARISPLLSQLAATTGNVDVYRSIHDGQLRHLDPSIGFGPHWQSALMSLLYMTPGGQNLIYAVQQGEADVAKGSPWQTVVSQAVKDTAGKQPEQLLLQWLTGVNPPYEYAAKTPGTPPSDSEYAKLDQLRQDHAQRMSALSNKALHGQMTPSQWRTAYHDESQSYADDTNEIFHGAPAYRNGSDAVLGQYEDLYSKATDKVTGQVDYAKLTQLQGEYRHKLSPEQEHALDSALSGNDEKYPMVKLYHQTTAAYGKWQEQWASKNGVDVTTLRADLSQYSALYNDRAASTAFVRQHPDVAAYERAKKAEFDVSAIGLMYGLFYDSSVVNTYLARHHLNTPAGTEQIEQAAQAQEAQLEAAG